jgi:hypothetical protein
MNTATQTTIDAASSRAIGQLLAIADYIDRTAHPTRMTTFGRMTLTSNKFQIAPVSTLVDIRCDGAHIAARGIMHRQHPTTMVNLIRAEAEITCQIEPIYFTEPRLTLKADWLPAYHQQMSKLLGATS